MPKIERKLAGLMALALLWSLTLTAQTQKNSTKSGEQVFTGCLGQVAEKSTYVLDSGTSCILVAGDSDFASVAGYRVTGVGTLQQQTLRVTTIRRAGGACNVHCKGAATQTQNDHDEDEGSRGLKPKEEPGSEGSTPGAAPKPLH